jgi:hypothetical protein
MSKYIDCGGGETALSFGGESLRKMKFTFFPTIYLEIGSPLIGHFSA